jgi:hypothetical protein
MLPENCRRLHEYKIRQPYLSYEIQNELLKLMASKMKETIVKITKRVKCFAILLAVR